MGILFILLAFLRADPTKVILIVKYYCCVIFFELICILLMFIVIKLFFDLIGVAEFDVKTIWVLAHKEFLQQSTHRAKLKSIQKGFVGFCLKFIATLLISFLKAYAGCAFLVTFQAAPSPIIERRQGNAVSTGRTGRGIQQKIHPKYDQKAFFLPKQTKKSIFSRKIFAN